MKTKVNLNQDIALVQDGNALGAAKCVAPNLDQPFIVEKSILDRMVTKLVPTTFESLKRNIASEIREVKDTGKLVDLLRSHADLIEFVDLYTSHNPDIIHKLPIIDLQHNTH